MKKLISLMLCAFMIVGLAACGSGTPAGSSQQNESKTETGQPSEVQSMEPETSQSSTGAKAIDFDEEPYNIHVCYAVSSDVQPDLAMVQEKLNEITLKEINATVELEAVSMFSQANVYALKASSQEKNDLMIMFPGYMYMASFANSNMIRPVEEELAEWGSDIQEVLGESVKTGQFKGHQYAIPQKSSGSKNANGFHLSKKLCDKYNIDASAIDTIEELEAAFELIKQNEPEVTVLMSETAGLDASQMLLPYRDVLSVGAGVVMSGSTEVVSIQETEEYMNACKIAKRWYDKGYISKDVLTTQENGAQALSAGKCFAISGPSVTITMGGEDRYSVIIDKNKPMYCSNDDQLILWGVSSNCKRPDKAIQFLNLCFASEEVSNLLRWGIEGTHYNRTDIGTVVEVENSGWHNPWNLFGDEGKIYVDDNAFQLMKETYPEVDTVEKYREKVWEVEYSPAYGFNFDPTNVKTEIASCDAVHSEFGSVIGNGTVDPETEIPKYIQKLKDAGVQKVVEEKQRQLDEWLAEQK
ncbi:DUF3502 domain-containing protein [Eisenbergiella sp.]